MTTTTFQTLPTSQSAETFASGWQHGKSDALAGNAPLFVYPADIALYARYAYVSAYVDSYEVVTKPV